MAAATPRRYAEDTKTPVANSQAEIKKWLKAAGADQVAVLEANTHGSVGFRMAGRYYRLDVPTPTGRNAAQEERRAWRLVLLLVRAKLEAAKAGASSIEREFMGDTVMPDGSTFWDVAAPQLALSYKSGKMPGQMLLMHDGRGPG